ncbi:MAG: mandelate racemase/muconate lactonizing enzyme family protein [Alphaproteobacteria bacterium]|nr:mandelate racemase/muconate lactonizing enzyme family protein [Alphaproteobacteria bacterium]
MRIVAIDGYRLSCRSREPLGNSTGFFDLREALFLRLECESGAFGWGETWFAPEVCGGLIRSGLAAAVLGADALAPVALWRALDGRRGFDRRGLTTMAISAIDIAAWDLAGRLRGEPVWRLAGGRVRDRVPAYASGPFLRQGSDPYRGCEAEAESYLRQGFRAVKPRIGTTPARDGAAMRALRRACGPDVALLSDLNIGFTADGAARIAEAIAPSSVLWLEEPVPPEDLAGFRALRPAPMAIAAGEHLIGLAAFQEYFAAGLLDIAQPDIALTGGLTEAFRIAALAEACNVPLCPHVWGACVNFHASLQLVATLPARKGPAAFPWPVFEYDQTDNPLLDLAGRVPVAPDGTVAIPDAPGIGIELDPAAFAPHLVEHWRIAA